MRYLWIVALMVLFISCEDEDPVEKRREQAVKDEELIKNYLDKNNIQATRYEVEYKYVTYGIYYIITREGEGVRPDYSSTVSAKYSGWFIGGAMFDSSEDEVVHFSLQSVIPGWTYGIPLMRPGGRATFYFPSGLAYGENGKGSAIPPNANLQFDVTLVNHY